MRYSFSIWGCILKGCFERGIFWRPKSRLKGIEDFNLELCLHLQISMDFHATRIENCIEHLNCCTSACFQNFPAFQKSSRLFATLFLHDLSLKLSSRIWTAVIKHIALSWHLLRPLHYIYYIALKDSRGEALNPLLTVLQTWEHYWAAWLCSILCQASDMGLRYLTFMGRNLENKKRLTMLVQIMNKCWFE